MKMEGLTRRALIGGRESLAVFLTDVAHGLFALSHSMLAVVGIGVVGAALFLVSHPEWRDTTEAQAWGWLQARHLARSGGEDLAALAEAGSYEPTAADGATAADPAALTRSQAAVAHWLARRYRVAPEPVARLVQEAWTVGKRTGLEPTLILAVMAVESSFNPFAQSPVGAQGLMQVMTKLHDDKYEPFGGHLAAFDPVSNLRVGVSVLKDCISRANGGVEAGLRNYVGAGLAIEDGGYALKVLAERQLLQRVAAGQNVPIVASALPLTPVPIPAVVTAPAAAAPSAPASAPASTTPAAPSVQNSGQQVALAH